MNNQYLVYLLLFTYAVSAATRHHLPLIIYKNPRSGSSWFASLLNKIPAVYITEEIITTHSTKHGNILEDGLSYLERGLDQPMLRYGKGKNLTASTRHLKWRVIGFTLSPKNAFGIDLSLLAQSVPTARLVVYLRTNKIKHAVSLLRGERLKEKCGYNIIKNKCRIPNLTSINQTKFGHALFDCIAKDRILLRKAGELAAALGRPFHQIYYEDLLRDTRSAFLQLFTRIGLQQKLETPKDISGDYVKSTSDDLRQTVENYASIEVWVKQNVPCLLTQLYEVDAGVVQAVLVEYPDCGILANKAKERENVLSAKEVFYINKTQKKFHKKEMQMASHGKDREQSKKQGNSGKAKKLKESSVYRKSDASKYASKSALSYL